MGTVIKNDITKLFDLEKLNSATKYPSIMTYHALGDKGRLTEELTPSPAMNADDTIYITEKIDGTNTMIIFYKDDYIIGSRESLTYAKGDRIKSSDSLGAKIITDACRFADRYLQIKGETEDLVVVFGEAYGGRIQNGACYTRKNQTAFRTFDGFAYTESQIREILAMSFDEIASQRQHLRRPYFTYNHTGISQLESVGTTVPFLGTIKYSELPVGVEEAYEFLKQFSRSRAVLDSEEQADPLTNKIGRAEGIVIRNADRSFIKKLRFESYEKTIRTRDQQRKR